MAQPKHANQNSGNGNTRRKRGRARQHYRPGTTSAGRGSIAGAKPPKRAQAPRAAAPAGPPAPPKLVGAFATPEDMAAVNDWLTQWTTSLEDIDYGIQQQQLDTQYAKGQNNQSATEQRSASDEAMAARGVFGSSLRDAAVLDIEASRALANTYLDNKLNATVTAGTARKTTLATAKTKFDAAMKAKYAENAHDVNDTAAQAYANALAAYKPPKPAAAAPAAAKTPKPRTPKAPKHRKPKLVQSWRPTATPKIPGSLRAV